MSKAAELAERAMQQAQDIGPRKAILSALAEYGAAVRAEDVKTCRELLLTHGDECDDLLEEVIHTDCAAAIGRMPLP